MWARTQRCCRRLILASTSVVFLNLAICPGSENFLEFRDTAGPTIEQGVETLLGLSGGGGEDDGSNVQEGLNQILGGVIDGIFQVIEPDSTTTSSN